MSPTHTPVDAHRLASGRLAALPASLPEFRNIHDPKRTRVTKQLALFTHNTNRQAAPEPKHHDIAITPIMRSVKPN